MTRLSTPTRLTGRGHWKAAPLSWNVDSGMMLERSEFWDVLGRCVTTLPEPLADAFLAIEVGGLGRDRVCDRFRITPANLLDPSLFVRLGFWLRQCLEHHWFAEIGSPPRNRPAHSTLQSADTSR